MPIHLNCPVCAQRLRVPNFAAGRLTKCTACGNAVRVPQPKKLLEKDEGVEATEETNNKSAAQAPLSVSELWYRSIERLSGSLVVDPSALMHIGWTPPLTTEVGLARLMQTLANSD